MKRVLTDHGEILHWMGAHHLFPVRGGSASDLAFAGHGELEGRTPIGWNDFFPALNASRRAVVVDDEGGTAEVLDAAEAARLPAPAAS